jgi:hypothetical protein
MPKGSGYKPKGVSRKGSKVHGGIAPQQVNRPSSPGGASGDNTLLGVHLAWDGMDGQTLDTKKSPKRRGQLGK